MALFYLTSTKIPVPQPKNYKIFCIDKINVEIAISPKDVTTINRLNCFQSGRAIWLNVLLEEETGGFETHPVIAFNRPNEEIHATLHIGQWEQIYGTTTIELNYKSSLFIIVNLS